MILTNFLGTLCQDKVTGFTGVCTGVVFYATGCHQALVVPRVGDSNKLPESHWFDLQRLEVLERDWITFENGATPGCDAAPPGGTRA